VNKKVIVVAVIGVLLVAVFSWRQLNKVKPQVWVAPVLKGTVEATVSNTRAGTIKACRRSKLSMSSGGVVDQLLVEEGDKVSEGQLLLALWNDDLTANIFQAENTIRARQHERQQACLMADFNRREADRKKSLLIRNLASEEEVDNAITTAKSQQQMCEVARDHEGVAKANLELQKALFERTQLRAPFDGVIAEINGEVGEFVTPSPPGIATPPAVDLIDYSCLYVTAPIDEIDASQVRIGLPVLVSLDAFRGREFAGEVVRVAPYVTDVEKQARTVEVEVRLADIPEDVRLLVGYSADMTIILQRKEGVLKIPTEAILSSDEVWVLDNGQLQLRSLKTGIGNWTFTEVLEGLNEGDLVVRSPDAKGIAEGVQAEAIHD